MKTAIVRKHGVDSPPMTFTREVREGRIRGPQQRGYNESNWAEAFAKHSVGSLGDQHLHQSGLWFGRRMASARSAWDALPRIPFPSVELARLLVGLANYRTVHLRLGRKEFVKQGESEVSTFVDYMRELDTLSQHVEHFVESLRVPLSNALGGFEPNGEQIQAGNHEALVNGLNHRTILGQQYVGLEKLWSNCVWNDWYVSESDGEDVVRPADVTREIWRAASQYRRSALQIEKAHYIMDVWKQATVRQRREWASIPTITGVSRHAKRLRFDVGSVDFRQGHPPFAWTAGVVATEEYLDGILDEPLPDLGAITIRELLDARWLFAPLGEILSADALSMDQLLSKADLEACAPCIHSTDCVDAIRRGLGASEEKAKTVLLAMTFDGSARDETWLKPFVRLEGEWLTVLFEPIRTASLVWSIDAWLSRGKADMAVRGPAFEQSLRKDLTRSNRLTAARIVPHAVTLRSAEGSEEIDIIIRIGQTLLIGEAKCSVFPAEPYEFVVYESVLVDGSAQVNRKAEFVRRNLEELCNVLSWTDLELSRTQVVPIVITNLQSGAACPAAVTAVTDRFILQLFLRDGKLKQFVTLEPDGKNEAAFEIRFYESPEAAEQVVAAYVKEPPQLSLLTKACHVTVRPLIHFDQERAAGYVAVLCDPYGLMVNQTGQSPSEHETTG